MSDTALRKIIKDKGPLTFAAFMELVLYHPVHGYYSSGRPIIGKEGDFYTSVHVSSLFGELITEQLVEMAAYLSGPVFQLVEYGAGKGYLAYDILNSLNKKYPHLFSRTQYYIIEKGKALKEAQKKLLGVFGDRVRWIDCLEYVDKPFQGCVLSNELVDAFPVHVVECEKGALKEIYVKEEDGEIKECTGPLSTMQIQKYFDSFNIKFVEGQRGEVCLAAQSWLKEIGETLDRGFVMTIDYGYEAHLLYHPVRKDGTIMCYKKHKSSENPYIKLGEQDITAHVNFTALQKWGNDFGLTTVGFTNQMHFLFNLGVVGLLEKQPEKAFSAQQLLNPEGMGGIFKVLIQQKGTAIKKLKGLTEIN